MFGYRCCLGCRDVLSIWGMLVCVLVRWKQPCSASVSLSCGAMDPSLRQNIQRVFWLSTQNLVVWARPILCVISSLYFYFLVWVDTRTGRIKVVDVWQSHFSGVTALLLLSERPEGQHANPRRTHAKILAWLCLAFSWANSAEGRRHHSKPERNFLNSAPRPLTEKRPIRK